MSLMTVAAAWSAQLDVPAGRFFGPCSGRDIPLAFQVAARVSDRFTFCDLSYSRESSAAYAVPSDWTLVSRIAGRDEQQPTKFTWYNGQRPIQPFAVLEVWRRSDESECCIELRRDLAQDALLELFAPRSISFFMHLNDGVGEGGSDLWFLARSGMPTGSQRGQGLLDAVTSRLADGAVVLTDGALAEDGFLKDEPFKSGNVRWSPLGVPLQTENSGRRVGLWRAEHCQ